MKKAIIFDNDGVLVNTEGHYFQATREMCARLDVELTLEDFIDCHINNSYGTRYLLGLPDAEYDIQRQWRNRRYMELLENGNLTFPGIPELIEKLAAQFRLCIVTSSKKEHFDLIHRNSAYLKHFEFVIALEDVSESKPSPEPYQKAVEQLGLARDACVVVEDSYRGLQSALAAGIDCYIIAGEFSPYLDFTGARKVLQAADDLLEELLQD